MAVNYFVTGTDTEVGKTLVAEALLVKAKSLGLKTIGLKPVAAGAELVDGVFKNEDAIRLQKVATESLCYEQVNPVCFRDPVAPHIAALLQGKRLQSSSLVGYIRGAMMQPADMRIIEGAGGWLLPLNYRECMNAVVKELQVEVILVVGLKLGCLNHALLTAQAIRQDGLHLAGWVATQIDPEMQNIEENLETLQQMIPGACLGYLPYEDGITGDIAAARIELPLNYRQ